MNEHKSRELIITSDGSHTIGIPELGVTYHSTHGAVQESMHVFIEAGLKYCWNKTQENESTKIFELGFGTGLNALLSCDAAVKTKRKINYTTVEAYPLSTEITSSLNYDDPKGYLKNIHAAEWDKEVQVNEYFILIKKLHSFQQSKGNFDLVYYDAFAPATQPDLWSIEAFTTVYTMLNQGGILTTYCSKSEVRRNMKAAGLKVEKIPGPLGKREMVRAHKVS